MFKSTHPTVNEEGFPKSAHLRRDEGWSHDNNLPEDVNDTLKRGREYYEAEGIHEKFNLQPVMEFLEAVDPDSLSDLRSLNHLELQELIAISPLFDTGNQLQFQLLVGLIRSLCKQAGTSAVDELLQYGQEQLTHTQIQCMVDRRQRRVTSTLEPTLEELKNGCYGQCERVMDTVSYGPWDYKEKSVKIVTSKLAMLDKLMSACRNNYAVRVKLTDGSEDMGIISLPIEIGDNMFILETPRGKYKIHLDFVDELRIYVK